MKMKSSSQELPAIPPPSGGNIEATFVVGFTGTRDGLTHLQDSALRAWFVSRGRGAIHHGDCIGADAAAHHMASYHGWWIEVHPGMGPNRWRAYVSGYSRLHPVKPNLERNDDIVAAAGMLLACPRATETLRSGTWSTVRKARKRGLPITIIWPSGEVTAEPAHGLLGVKTGADESPGMNPK